MAAIGDSVHLKNRFGAGYRLNVSLDEKNGGGAEEVLSVVQTVIPSAVQGQYTDSVSSINVPPESTKNLPAAFDALDECKASTLTVFHPSMFLLSQRRTCLLPL